MRFKIVNGRNFEMKPDKRLPVRLKLDRNMALSKSFATRVHNYILIKTILINCRNPRFFHSVSRQNVVTDMLTICQQHKVSIVIVGLPNATSSIITKPQQFYSNFMVRQYIKSLIK